MDDLLARVYRVFAPAPLGPDQSNLYVDLEDVRGHEDPVPRLAQRIRLSDGPTCQLLSGHHGSGKSTELRRLERNLGEGDRPFFVVRCEAKTDLDLNDVEFPEVLVTLVRHLADQVKQRENIRLEPGYFEDRWERLKSLLGSEVTFEGLELDVGMLKIATAIKNSPDAREKVREALEPDMGNLLFAANDVIGNAKLQLATKGYHDLVIVIDDLDKMVRRPHAAAKCLTDEHLFINRQAQLSGFQCHTVYTLPLALSYSVQERRLESLYGAPVPVLPMVKISTRPPRSRAFPPGMDCFRKIIAKRLSSAGVDEDTVFANDSVRDMLIRMSGGQPRELMILIREALVGGELPINNASVVRAQREGERAYARQLRDEHWKVIDGVRKTGGVKRTRENDEVIRELLDSRAVLQYVNDEEWYGVNPLIAAPKPKPKARKSK